MNFFLEFLVLLFPFTERGIILSDIQMTARVRFDYFSGLGNFIKSDYENITFMSMEYLERTIADKCSQKGGKYNDNVYGHVMEVF